MRLLVSIIVPIYNMEHLLFRSIDSILAQTYDNIEVILIDDGSSDSSPKICDKYAEEDSRVKVLHKTNGGVASARQSGIEIANGDFAIHVDPDDWVEPMMIEEMLNWAISKKSEYVIADFIVEKGSITNISKQNIESTDCRSVMKSFFQGNHGSCCNKLVSKKFYKSVPFEAELNLSEDLLYNLKILKLNPIVSYCPKAFYHYVCAGTNSQSKRYDIQGFREQQKVINKLLEIADFDKSLSSLMRKRLISSLAVRGVWTKGITASEYRHLFGKL